MSRIGSDSFKRGPSLGVGGTGELSNSGRGLACHKNPGFDPQHSKINRQIKTKSYSTVVSQSNENARSCCLCNQSLKAQNRLSK